MSGFWYGPCQQFYFKCQEVNGYSGKESIYFKIIQFVLRGARISDEERKKLNLKALEYIYISLGIPIDVTKNEFGEHFVGYANYYLDKCWNESKLKNKADVAVYKPLLEIDAKLGTTQSEQLFQCVRYSVRMDLIKV